MIEYPQVDVIVSDSQETPGELMLRSPAVGQYELAPLPGEVVVGGSPVGRLTVLGRTVELIVPRGATGRVADRQLSNRSDAVEYGQVLFKLVPVEVLDGGDEIVSKTEEASRDLPAGTFAVTSPTHGMFYRRPRPDEPAYVETGQIVETGSTLGLVEVMKCFSAIVYGGNELPPRAEIVEVRCDDGAEVESDQILFVVRPK